MHTNAGILVAVALAAGAILTLVYVDAKLRGRAVAITFGVPLLLLAGLVVLLEAKGRSEQLSDPGVVGFAVASAAGVAWGLAWLHTKSDEKKLAGLVSGLIASAVLLLLLWVFYRVNPLGVLVLGFIAWLFTKKK